MGATRPIRFVVDKPTAGTSITRYGLAEQMCVMGIDASVIAQSSREIEAVKDSIVIFVKKFDPLIVETIKRARNFIIWSPVDFFAVKSYLPDFRLFDGVIFPNSRARTDFAPLFKPDIGSMVIGGYADPRWRQAKPWRYRLAYMGHRKNIADCYKNIKGMHLEYFKKSPPEIKRFFRRSRRYSCHFSVRKTGSPAYLYKPNTKVTGAAACGANIILSKDPAHREILDPDYPYYTDSDVESVREMVKFARATYQKAEWKKGLEMLREVKEKTSRESIAKVYSEFFQTLD